MEAGKKIPTDWWETVLWGWVSYGLTNQHLIGILQWIGLFATVYGLWMALRQIKRIATATEAASKATKTLVEEVFSRERLIEIRNAVGKLESAKSHVSQWDFKSAEIFADLSHKEMLRVQVLLSDNKTEADNLTTIIIRTAAFREFLLRDADADIEEDESINQLIEATAIVDLLEAMGSRLRFNYVEREAK